MNDDDTSASIHGERDNFDSIDEKIDEGKETRDGDAYDESHYKVTISGKKNVQAAIQALVGDNGDYGAVVLQDEGGSIRIFLNPKSVDMDGVTTLAQAQAANEQLKQGIEERNRQAIAAWEARTGLKYDTEWRAKQEAEAQATQDVEQGETQEEQEPASSVMDAQDALARAGWRGRGSASETSGRRRRLQRTPPCRRRARRARVTCEGWPGTWRLAWGFLLPSRRGKSVMWRGSGRLAAGWRIPTIRP